VNSVAFVRALIRFTAASFWTCVAFASVLYCGIPLALGVTLRAFFDSFGGDAGLDTWTAVVLVTALQLSEVVTELAVSRAWSGFSYKSHALLQRNLFAGLLDAYGARGLTMPPAEALARFREDPPSITSGSMDGICDLVARAAFAVVAVVVMAAIDPVLMAVAFAPVIAAALVSDALGTRSSRYGAAALESTTGLTRFLGELLGSHLAIRVAGAESRVVDRLEQIGERRRRLSIRDRVFGEIVNSMNYHLVHVGTGVVLLVGASGIRRGTFSVGDFALFVVFLDQLTYLPAEIGRVVTELKRTAVSIERMHALVPSAPPSAIVAPAPVYLRDRLPDPSSPPPRHRLVRLDVAGVTAVHPLSGRGVSDISFTIERGTVTVVTGRVGAGKTTLLHAVLGLLPRAGGEIRWNGEIVDPATFLVPPRAAFTPQVPRLFSESLRDNIVAGYSVTARDVDDGVRAAVLEDDIEAFAAGLDVLVGSRGVRLSGGQLHRAAAARMFVRRPELLVFDDLSSALDATTEAELWRRLFERDDLTCLVVSHSPVALARADHVVTLDAGRMR